MMVLSCIQTKENKQEKRLGIKWELIFFLFIACFHPILGL